VKVVRVIMNKEKREGYLVLLYLLACSPPLVVDLVLDFICNQESSLHSVPRGIPGKHLTPDGKINSLALCG